MNTIATAERGPGPVRVVVPLVIEMTAAQAATYCAGHGLPQHDGPLRVKDVVDDVRTRALAAVQDSPAFGETGGERAAAVSLARR
jgi:hypothetical protein